MYLVKSLGRDFDDRPDIIVCGSVCDDNDVDRLRLFSFLTTLQVRTQNLQQSLSKRRPSSGTSAFEDLSDCACRSDVLILLVLVDEVDVDAIVVVLDTGFGDGLNSRSSLTPVRASHGAGVVNQELRVELTEKGKFVIVGDSRCCKRR